MKLPFWILQYIDHQLTESTPGSTINQTDQKHYLHYHSAHPRNQKEWYGHLSRSKRICTDDNYLEERSQKIYNQLKYRKYPTNLQNQSIQCVRNIDRLTLLRSTIKKQPENNIRLITNYNPGNPNLLKTPKKFEGLLLMTRKPSAILDNIQITYSRSPNLRYACEIKSILPTTAQTFSTMLATKMSDLHPHE